MASDGVNPRARARGLLSELPDQQHVGYVIAWIDDSLIVPQCVDVVHNEVVLHLLLATASEMALSIPWDVYNLDVVAEMNFSFVGFLILPLSFLQDGF